MLNCIGSYGRFSIHNVWMRYVPVILFCTVLIHSCVETIDGVGFGKARQHSQRVIDSLHSGHVHELFNEKYFNRAMIKKMPDTLGKNCAPQSRKGGFLDEVYINVPDGIDEAVFRYSYEYDCHKFIFVFKYFIADPNFEFNAFQLRDGGETSIKD